MKKHAFAFVRSLVAMLTICFAVLSTAPPAAAQNPSGSGQYGLTSWAINNQRVASQFNYDVDSIFGSGLGAFTFPDSTCRSALSFAGNNNKNPFNTNASVKINDITSANSETVALNSITISGGLCTLSLATSNAHSSYHLRSGTCGLQEAINDLGLAGGEILITQEYYNQGCSQSTITGVVASKTMANILIRDISNAQDTWYGLKPTATTLITPAAAPTTGTVAGGTFTNGNVLVSVTYVDALGGESLPSSETTQATGGTTNGLTVTSPAATTGAVGYRVYMTAVGGSTGTGVLHTTTSNCTQTTLETILPGVCAIGANTTVLAPITSTSKVPIFSTAHTTIAYQPFSAVPPLSSSANGGGFYTESLPFSAVTTITAASSSDVAVFYVPPGMLNFLGKTVDICFKAASTNVATAIPTWTLTVATAYAQSPVTLNTVVLPTQTGAVTTDGCFSIQTAVTGSSGKFWAGTLGPITEAINSTGVTVAGMDVTTAASSTIDLTKGLYFAINLGATTANITGVTVNNLSIRPVPGS